MVCGSGGGPLAPLADQLNHDVTHLQGQRLEGMLAQVMTLARAGCVTIASQPVRLPPRPALPAGRVGLLAELDARLAGGEGAGPAVVALYGLGGAGKTSVAVEYAHRHLDEVGLAWQFACEDPASAGGWVRRAGGPARRPGGDRCPGSGGVVHGVLAAFPASWLLVLDNAPDRAAVEPFLPPAGGAGS